VNRDDALSMLADPIPRQRLQAARALFTNATTDDYSVIRQQIDSERDAHVRRALVRVVHRIRPDPTTTEQREPAGEAEAGRDLIEDVWAEATEHITRIFVHEVSPLVGATSDAARRDLGEQFEHSDTNQALGRLTDLIELIVQLRRASTAPDVREFDVTDLVLSVVRDEGLTDDRRVMPARDDPVVITGPGAAIRIAFANGLRNARDAVDSLENPDLGEIVVNWTTTDRDTWIAVLDNGIGLPEGSHRVFEFGVTTKPKSEHFGFGLAISLQAMQSAGGTIEIGPRNSGGTSFILRWPHAEFAS
jgi:signal transduction histidine kinase